MFERGILSSWIAARTLGLNQEELNRLFVEDAHLALKQLDQAVKNR